jgi:uncharacterized membrane protein
MSARTQWRVMLALAVIGLAVATYLTIVHYVGFGLLVCTTTHAHLHGSESSCQTVQSSVYSSVLGIPVALLGLIGYVLIVASLLVRDSDLTRVATLGITLFGTAFSGYLTYRELFTIHAICEWCVSSAVILTVLFVFAAVRYARGAPVTTA